MARRSPMILFARSPSRGGGRRRGRRLRKSKRASTGPLGKVGAWIKATARRPITRVLAPGLTLIGFVKIFTTADSGGYTAVDHVAAIVTSAKSISQGGQLDRGAIQGLPGALEAGLWNALPNFIGGAVAYVGGRLTHT